jgi:hypothetical protein
MQVIDLEEISRIGAWFACGLSKRLILSGESSELSMKSKTSTAACLAAAMIIASGSVQAAAVTYATTQGDAAGVFAGTPLASRAAFAATLTGYTSENFEGLVANTAPTTAQPLAILGGTGSITPVSGAVGSGKVANTRLNGAGSFPGRFNTTPAPFTGTDGQWWETSRSFTIAFGGSASAFGMYITDLADFRGTLDVDFCAGLVCTNFAFSSLNTVTGTLGNGALSFLGYTNDGFSFDRAVVNVRQISGIPQGQFDVIGFDDFIVGTVKNLPEPTSLALTGLALAAAGFAGRRTRRA